MTQTHITSNDIARFDELVRLTNISVPLVAVYCGSKQGLGDHYTKTAFELGQALVRDGFGLVYGGACIGVMGAVAEGVLSQNGISVGVIPTFLLDKEIAHPKLSHSYTTDTMHTRKALMAYYASAFVVLAGGLGTLEELMEVATWRQLYQHEKPIILVNTNGFYDRLFAHLRHTIAEGFMSPVDLDRLVVCDTVDEAMAQLSLIAQISVTTQTKDKVEKI